jgi:TetR/AcrR family transcriptional repressor of nem operon
VKSAVRNNSLDLYYDRNTISGGPAKVTIGEHTEWGGSVRYASDQKERTRAKILKAAGKVFRRHGYHAAGLDKVMEEAGLTAGAFYAHFDSKQELLAEALKHAAVEVRGVREPGLEGLSGEEWFDAFLSRYLSLSHRRQIEDGCPMPALVSEVSRADESVKQSFETIVRELVGKLASHARDDGCAVDSASANERALAAISMCVGGLAMARAVQDEGLADQIIESCRKLAQGILQTAEPAREPDRQSRKPKR